MKRKITLKDGTEIEFSPLTYNEKNLIKVRLNVNGEYPEGIWAVVSDEDKKDHDENKEGGYFVAMLANDAVMFYPNRSWGLHIMCKHEGDTRPNANVEWFDLDNEDNVIFSPDCDKNSDEEE